MSQRLPIRKTLRFFTMVEMLAVMAVAGVLLTITVSLSINDSSKANSRVMKGALQSAQTEALSKSKNKNDYTIVELVTGSKQIEVYYHEWDTSTNGYIATRESISQHSIVEGSKVSIIGDGDHLTGAANNVYFAFNYKGEPIDASGYDGSTGGSLDPTVVETNTFELSFVRNGTGEVPPKIYVRAFTGKILFY